MNGKRHINPLNDFFVRYLLGSEGNEDVCLSLVNAVLRNADFPPAASLTIKNPFNLKREAYSRESIVDVKAQDVSGRIFDVEVQIGDRHNFIKRSLYYGAKIYASQLGEGFHYRALKPVTIISLLDFSLWQDEPKPHSCFMLIDKDNADRGLTEDLIFHYLEMPKLDSYTGKMKKTLRAWLEYFQMEGREGEEKMRILAQEEPVLNKAHQLYKKFSAGKEYQEAYEAREKWRLDQLSELQSVRQQGIEQGIEQTALAMIQENFSVEQIARLTGLSDIEVENLKN